MWFDRKSFTPRISSYQLSDISRNLLFADSSSPELVASVVQQNVAARLARIQEWAATQYALKFSLKEDSSVEELYVGSYGYIHLASNLDRDATVLVTVGFMTRPQDLNASIEKIEATLEAIAEGEDRAGSVRLEEASLRTGDTTTTPCYVKRAKVEDLSYAKDAWGAHQQVKERLRAKDFRFGRLFLYEGPSGTGKTHLLKDLLDIEGCSVVRTEGADLEHLSLHRDHFQCLLRSARRPRRRHVVLLADEADASLVEKRNGSNNSTVASLLNLTDGLAGEIYDVSVVLAINQARMERLDEALRKGRLSVHVKVPLLPRPQAKLIFERMVLQEGLNQPEPPAFPELVSLGDVYHAYHSIPRDSA